jgi:hypothetical protein
MADPRKESGSGGIGQGVDEKAGEKREGASEQSVEKKGLPEHRDMGVGASVWAPPTSTSP